MAPFRFYHDCKAFSFPRMRLARLAQRLARGERLKKSRAVNVVLCSDYRIRKLNGLFRGKNRVTDVLAFTIGDRDLLGEIYISLPRASVQARRFGLSYEQEIERLLVHGFIHLLGYDHRTAQQRARMEQRENRYCILGAQVRRA